MTTARLMCERKPKSSLIRRFLMDSIRWHANNLTAEGQYEQASSAYSELIDHCMWHAKLNEVRELIHLKQFKAASENLEMHLQQYKTDIAALYLKGQLSKDMNNIQQAIKTLRQIIELAPGYLDAYYCVIPMAYRAGRHDVVEEALASIKKISPKNYELIEL